MTAPAAGSSSRRPTARTSSSPRSRRVTSARSSPPRRAATSRSPASTRTAATCRCRPTRRPCRASRPSATIRSSPTRDPAIRSCPAPNRNVTNRSYTVRIVHGTAPADGGPPNTLYDTRADGQSGRGLAYRLYLPDREQEAVRRRAAALAGDRDRDGQRIELPTCPDPLTDVGFTQSLGDLGLSDVGLPPAGALARATPPGTGTSTRRPARDRVHRQRVVPPELADAATNVTGEAPVRVSARTPTTSTSTPTSRASSGRSP